jgi:hypothetical protein
MELRKIKSFKAMSEETEAFTAQLWVDGKHIANVKNNGQGGCNNITPLKPFTYKDVDEYRTDDWDYKISMMVSEFDEIRKNQSKCFYLRKGDNLETCEYYKSKFPKSITRLKGACNYSGWLTNKLNNFREQGFTILNTNL